MKITNSILSTLLILSSINVAFADGQVAPSNEETRLQVSLDNALASRTLFKVFLSASIAMDEFESQFRLSVDYHEGRKSEIEDDIRGMVRGGSMTATTMATIVAISIVASANGPAEEYVDNIFGASWTGLDHSSAGSAAAPNKILPISSLGAGVAISSLAIGPRVARSIYPSVIPDSGSPDERAKFVSNVIQQVSRQQAIDTLAFALDWNAAQKNKFIEAYTKQLVLDSISHKSHDIYSVIQSSGLGGQINFDALRKIDTILAMLKPENIGSAIKEMTPESKLEFQKKILACWHEAAVELRDTTESDQLKSVASKVISDIDAAVVKFK